MRNPLATRVTWKSVALVGGVALLASGVQLTANATPSPDSSASSSAVSQSSSVAPPDDYYKDAEGKTGEELKTALSGIISNNEQLSYDQVWDALKVTDEDPDNSSNVLLLYTGRSESKDANGGDQGQWNREHVWAKSHGDFGTSTGPGTDIHHLRPTDVGVNSTRGNKDFDKGGEELSEAPGNFTDNDSFEPRDEVKGDVARMILYMAVRYEGEDSYPDLEPNDEVENGKQPLHGRLSVLKEWNELDPPDAREQKRNDVIFEQFQKNRNPFIDNPEWVNEIWS
ncbi:ribonuclease [Streptomyces sp. AJS327]|uniref:endonuclease I family protein n=1 Tax=Streptomyces sp. AJS327 TaxID=2545265 RepID=UPI0015DDDE99|nr:endonuclease [Streptomyces sp. AJS327]MBA0052636.1 ribonuclease [Streptomyces sp. AJS327]